MTVKILVCFFCKNYQGKKKCRAFKVKIPDVILNNKNKHSSPVKGDNGIQFEPIK